jgi:hypothetical protein
MTEVVLSEHIHFLLIFDSERTHNEVHVDKYFLKKSTVYSLVEKFHIFYEILR